MQFNLYEIVKTSSLRDAKENNSGGKNLDLTAAIHLLSVLLYICRDKLP